MKDYLKYDSVNLAQDHEFLIWAKYGSQYPEIDLFWKTWLQNNPEQKGKVLEAKKIIQAVLLGNDALRPQHIQQQIWQKLQLSIHAQQKTPSRFLGSSVYRIAAAVMLLISVSGIFWLLNNSNRFFDDKYVTTIAVDMIEKINNSNKPMTVILSDGSSVILQPSTKLNYPIVFDDTFRQVRLSGEAFFEVVKNPQKPFIVKADKLTTKVLGTSFMIRALNDQSDVLVQVKTGKVSVFKSQEGEGKIDSLQEDSVILIPNQQVVFSRKNFRLEKSLIDNPEMLNKSIQRQFVFQNTPLEEVFQTLQEAYGIQIIYDRKAIINCSLDASLDDLPLYDKLRVICKGLNAKYQVIDSQIVFSSPGCK